MKTFHWTAVDAKGEEHSGVMDADSETNVVTTLREKGFFPTHVGAQPQTTTLGNR
jgi:type II secretory pathway component PulF